MKEVFLGEYIKQRRLDLGLTQEQLCEGICEPMTLSRLENGRQTPSRNRINALLQSLGLPDDRYFALLSKHEMEIEQLQKEICFCIDEVIKVKDNEGWEQRYERGMEALRKLEAIAEEDDRITRQFILRAKVSLDRFVRTVSLEEQLELLMEAIRLTVPRFDLEEINDRLYSIVETGVIVTIAGVYADHGQNRKAVDIYSQVLKYTKKHFQNISDAGNRITSIATNLALALNRCKRYEESVEIAEEGREACFKSDCYSFLPPLLWILGDGYHFLGDDEKSKEMFYQSYYSYKAIGDSLNAGHVQRSAREYYGISFEF